MEELEELTDDYEGHLTFKLEGFEGPLDLLLHLIKENNMSIETIRISEITDQYLKYMEDISSLNMDEAVSFLDMTSRLLEIKSKALLPVEKDEQMDDQEDDLLKLKMDLKEHELFKEAGANLQQYENVDRFYKQPDKMAGDTRIVFNDFNLDKMLDAFAFILMRAKDRENPEEKQIRRDRWTVADKIAFLTTVLKENKEINFFSLFDDSYTKSEIINTFLAILEMLKFQKIVVVQADKYQDILIKAREEE